MQHRLLAGDDEGVARIVAALEADDDIGALGEHVDDLPLPLIAPLGADDHDIRHGSRAGYYKARVIRHGWIRHSLSTTGTGLEDELAALHEKSTAWALACAQYDRAEAEDVLQTAYLEILDGRAHFGGRSSLKTFVFGVI